MQHKVVHIIHNDQGFVIHAGLFHATFNTSRMGTDAIMKAVLAVVPRVRDVMPR